MSVNSLLQRPGALLSLWVTTLTMTASVVTVFVQAGSASDFNKYKIMELSKEHVRDVVRLDKDNDEGHEELKKLTEAINKLTIQVARINGKNGD